MKKKDFFEDISVSYLSPDLWGADFEVKVSSPKALVREKISARCIAWEAACPMELVGLMLLVF